MCQLSEIVARNIVEVDIFALKSMIIRFEELINDYSFSRRL